MFNIIYLYNLHTTICELVWFILIYIIYIFYLLIYINFCIFLVQRIDPPCGNWRYIKTILLLYISLSLTYSHMYRGFLYDIVEWYSSCVVCIIGYVVLIFIIGYVVLIFINVISDDLEEHVRWNILFICIYFLNIMQ